MALPTPARGRLTAMREMPYVVAKYVMWVLSMLFFAGLAIQQTIQRDWATAVSMTIVTLLLLLGPLGARALRHH
jgi:hypothetical protein